MESNYGPSTCNAPLEDSIIIKNPSIQCSFISSSFHKAIDRPIKPTHCSVINVCFDEAIDVPVNQPTSPPSFQPSMKPSTKPSSLPLTKPTTSPSCKPSSHPSAFFRSMKPSIVDRQLDERLFQRYSSYLDPPQDAMLSLLPWEVASMAENETDRVCQPPVSIPKYCCLGSTSKGGGTFFIPNLCRHNIDAHHYLANYTRQYLNRTTIRRSTHTSSLHQQDCDGCRIIDYLMIKNWTLSLQGDSISR